MESTKIATQFKLSANSVKSLLKYCSDFNVQVAPKIQKPLEEITQWTIAMKRLKYAGIKKFYLLFISSKLFFLQVQANLITK